MAMFKSLGILASLFQSSGGDKTLTGLSRETGSKRSLPVSGGIGDQPNGDSQSCTAFNFVI